MDPWGTVLWSLNLDMIVRERLGFDKMFQTENFLSLLDYVDDEHSCALTDLYG